MNKKALAIAFFTIFLDLLGFGIIIPNNAFYILSFDTTPATVTLISAAYSLMQFLFAPFWGRLSDRLGRRPIILWSICISCVGHLLFGLAPTLTLIFVARILAGFGNANLGAAQAIISDCTTPENRAKGMGLIGVAFGLGFLLGPAIGGIASTFDPRAPSFVAAALAVVNFAFAFLFLKETKTSSSVKTAKRFFTLKVFREAALTRDLATFFYISLIYTFAFSLFEQVLAMLLNDRYVVGQTNFHIDLLGLSLKTGPELTAAFLVAVGLTAVIVQGNFIGKLSLAFGERKLLRFGLGAVGLSIGILPLVSLQGDFLLMMALAVFLACGTGTLNPSLSALVSKEAPPENQGQTLGVYQSMGSLGRVFGPMCAGYLYQLEKAAPFVLAAIILGFGFMLSFKIGKIRSSLTL